MVRVPLKVAVVLVPTVWLVGFVGGGTIASVKSGSTVTVKFAVLGAKPLPGSAVKVTVWAPTVAPVVTTCSDPAWAPLPEEKLLPGENVQEILGSGGLTFPQDSPTVELGNVPLVVTLKLSAVEVPVAGTVTVLGDVVNAMLTRCSATVFLWARLSTSVPTP